MTEQLPVISRAKNITTAKQSSATLQGRGLATMQSQKLAIADQEKRYRQARDIYNRITDYGFERRFNSETLPKRYEQFDLFEENLLLQLQPFFDMLQQLADVYKVFHQLAEKGYGKAYFPLALMYQGGQGISADIEKENYYSRLAFNWCFANQALNDPEIWTDLGWMYDHEIAVEADEESMFYFLHSTELDYSKAPFNVREWYETKWVRENDEYRCFNLAMLWYRKAADQGYARAQYNVGVEYLANPYSEQDVEVAALWFEEAAGQGYSTAQCRLGQMYNSEYGADQYKESVFWHLENEHLEQTVFWYQEAAEQGCADAQFDLGEIYEDPLGGIDVDFEQSVFWYKKAAVQGHAKAQCHLGSMYEDGRGTDEDLEQAVFWYHQSAKEGNSDAECNLGWMYESGRGVEQDDEKAIFWFREAAEQGNALAQLQMGQILEYDYYSCESDEQGMLILEEIYYWYRMSAEKGLAAAKYELGCMFRDGRYVDQDEEEALHWYRESAGQGHAGAQQELTKLGIKWTNN